MYESLSTSVKSMCGVTKYFRLGVGMCKGFSLIPYLFFVVMDEIKATVLRQYKMRYYVVCDLLMIQFW